MKKSVTIFILMLSALLGAMIGSHFGYNPVISIRATDTATISFEVLAANDTIAPTIELIAPEDDYLTKENNVIFDFNATDNSHIIENCSLIIDGNVQATSTSITNGIIESFSDDFDIGTYTWSINCTDFYNNIGNSSARTFTIEKQITPPAGGSTGGGARSVG